MRGEDIREGKEVKGLNYSSRLGNKLIEVKTSWKEHGRLYLPIQKHTNRVITLTKFPALPLIGDAVVTNLRDVELGVRTADCVPVVLIGKEWVGVIHAGWRGIASGVIEKTIERLAVFEEVDKLFAFLGPAAKSCCYEVGSEFRRLFPGYVEEREGKLYMDLHRAVMGELRELGVKSVGVLELCTVCTQELPSHRRDRSQERMLTSVRILG